MTTNNQTTNQAIDNILKKLTVDAGEEYHKLHKGEQDFDLTNARMNYYEAQALDAINKTIMEARLDQVMDDFLTLSLEAYGIDESELIDWREAQLKQIAKKYGQTMSKTTVELEHIDLNKWEWLRTVSGLFQETINHYRKLASKNEVLIVQIYGKDAFNIYIPAAPSPNTEQEKL